MSSLRHIVRAAFTLAILAVIALAGQIPFGGDSEQAVLRLALRTVHGKVSTCRDRTPEELAALPQHMRTPTICEERSVDYDLLVAVDGEPLLEVVVSPGGLRRDRPIIVDHQLPVPVGARDLRVRFQPSDDELGESAGIPGYELDRPVEFAPGRVALVTLDDATGVLSILQN